MAVISDKKLPEETGTLDSIADYYEPDLLSASDYYPFGMQMPGRNYMAEGYRFGFNGKEKDDNNEWGNLTHYDYGFRIHNPALGRFLSVDPLASSYPMLTPYQFASNTPIQAIDLDGLEAFSIHLDARASAYITVSVATGIIFDLKGNVGIFATPGVGGGYIGGLSAGGGVTVFPTAETIYDTEGIGVSSLVTGIIGFGISGSVDGALDRDQLFYGLGLLKEKPLRDKTRLGGTITGGAGLEAGVALEFTYTWIAGTTWSKIFDFISELEDEEKEGLKSEVQIFGDYIDNYKKLLVDEIENIGPHVSSDSEEIDKLKGKVEGLEKVKKNVVKIQDYLENKR